MRREPAGSRPGDRADQPPPQPQQPPHLAADNPSRWVRQGRLSHPTSLRQSAIRVPGSRRAPGGPSLHGPPSLRPLAVSLPPSRAAGKKRWVRVLPARSCPTLSWHLSPWTGRTSRLPLPRYLPPVHEHGPVERLSRAEEAPPRSSLSLAPLVLSRQGVGASTPRPAHSRTPAGLFPRPSRPPGQPYPCHAVQPPATPRPQPGPARTWNAHATCCTVTAR
jgi:hypothetical protein